MPIGIVIIILTAVIGGLTFASLATWLQHKEKQAEHGVSADELATVLAKQQDALEAAERRIQNLEAIVTSQSWDALRDGELAEPLEPAALPQGRIELDVSEAEPSDAERAARLARRV